MTEQKADDSLYIDGFNKEKNGVFMFHVKDKEYKDDDLVIPTTYGVDQSGKVLEPSELLRFLEKVNHPELT